ncbi:YdcF family protein [Alkalibacterium sp. f15]|uniref:YdcF family protein n=1 Tax=Alkalibacterium sp. f15 TaxID=3414029 RepID=UPI003BF7D5FA
MNINDISNYTGAVDPTSLIPHIGTGYKENDILREIVGLLEKWQYKSALIKLDGLINDGTEPVDALLLKGELLAHFDLNQDAAEAFKQVLMIEKDNIFAEMMLLIQLSILNSEREVDHYAMRLKEHSFDLYTAYEQVIQLIEEHKDQFKFPGNIDPIEVICVYGYILNEDGSIPEVLEKRLLKVNELAEQHPSAMILLSGGAVKNKYNEAVEMKKVLIKWGVNEQRLVSLERAKDTVGNVIEFMDYIQPRSFKHVCVVTSKAHLPRAWMTLAIALGKINYQTHLSGASPEEEIDKQTMEMEYKLNYQTLFRIAGLFEKKDITEHIRKRTNLSRVDAIKQART